jgi:hypothetical protein
MTEKKHVITRRDFIRSGSWAVMGGLLPQRAMAR